MTSQVCETGIRQKLLKEIEADEKPAAEWRL